MRVDRFFLAVSSYEYSAVAGAAGVSDVRSLLPERERGILVFLYLSYLLARVRQSAGESYDPRMSTPCYFLAVFARDELGIRK